MATKQHGGPKDTQRDTQRRDVGGDEQHHRVKTPSGAGEHPPGIDDDKYDVPERARP